MPGNSSPTPYVRQFLRQTCSGLIAAGWLALSPVCHAEDTPPEAPREITFDAFLGEVLAANLDLAAQRYNVDLARADATAARLWPNPNLSVSANRDLSYRNRIAPDASGAPVPQRLPESRSIGLTQTLELAGRRRWQARSADGIYRAAAATLEDFLRNLKLDAAAAFADALATRATVEQQHRATDYLAGLERAQRIRFERGDLSEADFMQSRLAELQAQNDLRQAEAAANTAQLALVGFLGSGADRVLLVPQGELSQPAPDADPNQLVGPALAARADLAALRLAADAAGHAVRAAQAGRFPSVDLGVTYTHSPASENFVAPSPPFRQLTVGLSLPLPLWDRNQHEIRKTLAAEQQAKAQLAAAELKAAVQVRTACTHCRTSAARVRQFESELLRAADRVLATRRYSYEHGQTSLLELIEAQRTANDIQQSYHEALADAAKARIELLRATGRSEIHF